MILTAMQPYFFPYIGYFQLLHCSDIFVVLDDVQYINRGWVNRNRILINENPNWFTFPVQKGAQELAINCRFYIEELSERERLLETIKHAYKKAPFFTAVYPLVERIMTFSSVNVGDFNTNAIKEIADYLKLQCRIMLSSEIEKDNSLKGQDRIVDINLVLGAELYVNPMGGVDLYQEERFVEKGLKLQFLKPGNIQYSQFKGSFVPFLSIIDVLMFNNEQDLDAHMANYELVTSQSIKDVQAT